MQDYEYSLNEVDTKFFNLKKFDDPDVRYYACVVDKNRAGAKPTLLFRLNLAYNVWEELRIFTFKTKHLRQKGTPSFCLIFKKICIYSRKCDYNY